MHRSVEENSLASPAAAAESAAALADTIAAISTPAGEGAIALVRLSGPAAVGVAEKIFRGKALPSQFQSHTQYLGEIVTDAGQLIDQVMMSIHRAPASYTGEDVVEISCHGGALVTAKVLEACLRAKARPARPGEFTERAFLNGKMDLTQAEAVIDLIRARSDLALRSATEQLEGKLGEKITKIRQMIVDLLANIEASIDFPEEGIKPAEGDELRARLDSIREEIAALLATADQGRILRDGVRVVIYGATNAGKSSLLNRLLGYERVIVSDTHGTTRDTIEETLNLRGIPIRLLDTAGLRQSESEIEREGIARTERWLQKADLRLHIVDRSSPPPKHFGANDSNGSELLILNKSDLPEHPDWRNATALRISCHTGEGLNKVEEAILSAIGKQNLRAENPLAINTRHRDCLQRALDACARANKALEDGVSPEYVSIDLKEALTAVGEVIGAVGADEILDSVFKQFCIGK
jgi:tRNA modification GTPase